MFEVKLRDGIAMLTLRHGKANALDLEFCRALTEQFAALEHAEAKAVVMTAEGGIFSAGVDLPRAADGGAAYLREFLPALDAMYRTIFFFPKPVVAAINGHAIAGGAVLACCADRRLFAQGPARMGVTELLVGLPFPALALEILRFTLNPPHFPHAIYSGATFEGPDALDRGFLDELAPSAELLERAVAQAKAYAAIRPETFAFSKAHLRKPVRDFYERDAGALEAAMTEIWCRPESTESVRTYVARTFGKKR
jgi:enoyl-CoA hydratase